MFTTCIKPWLWESLLSVGLGTQDWQEKRYSKNIHVPLLDDQTIKIINSKELEFLQKSSVGRSERLKLDARQKRILSPDRDFTQFLILIRPPCRREKLRQWWVSNVPHLDHACLVMQAVCPLWKPKPGSSYLFFLPCVSKPFFSAFQCSLSLWILLWVGVSHWGKPTLAYWDCHNPASDPKMSSNNANTSKDEPSIKPLSQAWYEY